MAGIEIELFHDIMLFVLVLTFAFIIFAASTAQTLNNSGGANSTAISSLNNTLNSMSNAGKNLSASLSVQVIPNIKSSDTLYFGEVAVNILGVVISFAIALLYLIIIDVISFIILIYVIVPSLLSASALGSGFGSIAALVYGICLTILSLYMVYILTLIFGFRKTSGHN